MRAVLVIYKIGLRFGILILPAHYSIQVPNITELAKTQSVWCKKSSMPGIPNSLDKQATNLRTMCLPYRDECAGNRVFLDATSKGFGHGFGYIEAQALHCVLRHLKPERIIEVGGGVSTRCMVHAVSSTKGETGRTTEITCIEPFPSRRLRELDGIRLLEKPVQEVEMDIFMQLERNDFLFIDSTHTVKPGGDVNYLVLEILPRLKPGVVVHFHDVFLPYDYSRDVLQTFSHGSETSLIRAFLINNSRANILFCMSQLYYDKKDVLMEVFPEFEPQADSNGIYGERVRPFEYPPGHFPSSLYLSIQ